MAVNESFLHKFAIVPPAHTSGECFDTPEDLPRLPFGTGIACAKTLRVEEVKLQRWSISLSV